VSNNSLKTWRTSSYTDAGGTCVEVCVTPEHTGIRDTKNRSAGTLVVRASAFAILRESLRDNG
jgi:hypothetical protein